MVGGGDGHLPVHAWRRDRGLHVVPHHAFCRCTACNDPDNCPSPGSGRARDADPSGGGPRRGDCCGASGRTDPGRRSGGPRDVGRGSGGTDRGEYSSGPRTRRPGIWRPRHPQWLSGGVHNAPVLRHCPSPRCSCRRGGHHGTVRRATIGQTLRQGLHLVGRGRRGHSGGLGTVCCQGSDCCLV